MLSHKCHKSHRFVSQKTVLVAAANRCKLFKIFLQKFIFRDGHYGLIAFSVLSGSLDVLKWQKINVISNCCI